MNDTALFALLLVVIGGPLVMVGVFLAARALVYGHGDPAKGREYIEWFRAERAAEGIWQDVEVELPRRRPAPTVRRRPVAAVTSTPHTDLRWSVLNKGLPR